MSDKTGKQIGNYRLIRLLGKGGFAEVWLGEHIHLHTYAALKILQPLDPAVQKMFLKEAKVITALSHPNIVRLFDYTIENTVPVIIMEYAPNGSLRDRHQRGNLVPLATVLSYLKQIAPALDYAHNTIIHRDIKPDNMLIKANGDILLSDFGIVAAIHSTLSVQTQTGKTYAGTAYYSAPEQHQGKPVLASDQYALGIVVYEWLSGTLPFTGSSYTEVAIKHITEQPEPLSQRNPSVPTTVEAAVMQALAKDPKQRFKSAQAFATAFEEATTPTVFQSVSSQPQLQLSLGVSGHVYSVAWSPDSKHIAYGGEDNVQIWDTETKRYILTYQGHSSFVSSVAWSPDGKYIASGSQDNTAQVWDAATGINIFTYHGNSRARGVSSVAWSPDSKRIASGLWDNSIQVWDATTGGNIFTYKVHNDGLTPVAWSPDGKYIASGGGDVQVWHVATGTNIYVYHGHSASGVLSVAWSPDSKCIASGGFDDNTVQIWDATTGGNVFTYKGHYDHMTTVAWSPDGKRIASGSQDQIMQIWDATTGGNVFTYKGLTDGHTTVAWSPDGKCIALGGSTVQVWKAMP